jgi:hypothetical protein
MTPYLKVLFNRELRNRRLAQVSGPAMPYQFVRLMHSLRKPGGDGGIVPTVFAPVFVPASGEITTGDAVTITSGTSGATIRFEIGGADPTESSGTIYTVPVAIIAPITLKAIAYKTGMVTSGITSADFTNQVGTPVFNPTGTVPIVLGSTIAVTTSTSGATIRYTIDGVTTPTDSVGTVYAVPITPVDHFTLKAIAYKAGQINSGVNTQPFSITSSILQWGVSASTTLTTAKIFGLSDRRNFPTSGVLSFDPGAAPEKYFYIVIKSTASMPRVIDGFVSGGFPMGGDFESGGSYDQTVNGWPYMNVTSGLETLRVFRTKFTQSLPANITLSI